MKVTIITVCFNSAKTIRDSIESVLEQTYSNIEYIIVDGGSTDGTLGIIDEYRSRISTVISEPDEGLWDAMNKGIAHATGDFFGFLNSDDVFANEHTVHDLASRLGSGSDVDAVFGFVDIVDPSDMGRVMRRYRVRKLNYFNLRLGIMPAHPGFLCNREFPEKYGKFLLDDRVAPDFELIVRFLRKGQMKAVLHPDVIVRMRHGGVGNSSYSYRLKRILRIVRSCKRNGVWTSAFLVLLKYPYRLFELIR